MTEPPKVLMETQQDIGTNLKKRQRSEEEQQDTDVEPAAKRSKQNESPPQVLFALTYKRLDDDYKRIEDHEEIVGLYPSHQLALAYQYEKMVEIIKEEMVDCDWYCIENLPSGLQNVNEAELRKKYCLFFEEFGTSVEEEEEEVNEKANYNNGLSLKLRLDAIKECISSLITAEDISGGWCNFEEKSIQDGWNFSELFDLLFQCEYRIGAKHQFEIERQVLKPSSIEWPELFKNIK